MVVFPLAVYKPGIRVTKLPPRWLMPLSTFKGQTNVLIGRRSECIDGIKERSSYQEIELPLGELFITLEEGKESKEEER